MYIYTLRETYTFKLLCLKLYFLIAWFSLDSCRWA